LAAARRVGFTANIVESTHEYLLSLPFPLEFLVRLGAALAELVGEVFTAGLLDNVEHTLYATEDECKRT
jgi:hypothetical protein